MLHEGCIEGGLRVDDADAVGADEADPVFFRNPVQLVLAPLAVSASFLEPRRDDHGPARPDFPERLEKRRDACLSDNDDGELRRFGKAFRRFVGFVPEYLFVPGVDGVEPALIAAFQKIQDLDRAHFVGIVARSHPGDRAGVHQEVKGVFRH